MFNIFSGAGISCAPPASLPLGRRFHRDLLDSCWAAAERYVPDLLAGCDRSSVWSGRWNVLARLAAGAQPHELPTVTSVLSGLDVATPTESHVLAAFHLAAGGLHVTLNLDNGIERAYALLSGAADLPDTAPRALREALPAWRARFPRCDALSVTRTPAALRAWRPGPGLVKLRGSLTEPALLLGTRPAFDTAESVELDRWRQCVLDTVTTRFVLVTGYSGDDLDCAEALMARLRAGAFAWVAIRIPGPTAERLACLDPGQPTRGYAAAGLRTHLADRGYQLPDWPVTQPAGNGYPAALARWRECLPGRLATHAVAWMCADSGQFDLAVALYDRLLADDGDALAAVRLADALCTRDLAGDRQRADSLYTRAARSSGAPRPLRTYAQAGRARRRGPMCRIRTVGVLVAVDPARAVELATDLLLAALARRPAFPATARGAAMVMAIALRCVLRRVPRRVAEIGRNSVLLWLRLAMLEAIATGVRPVTFDRVAWAVRVGAHLRDTAALRQAQQVLAYAMGRPRRPSRPFASSVTSPASGSWTAVCHGSAANTPAGE